jgi:galactan 5-O-arabinofuranosyltransferase
MALGSCLVIPFLMRGFPVNPVVRDGQVSALAALQLRFGAISILLVAALMLAHRLLAGRYFAVTKRLTCAGIAGIASGFLAGGIVIALLGTPWPIFGLQGDTGRLVEWSASIAQGHGNPHPDYPPLTLHIIAWWANWFHGGNTAFAFRDLEILGAAVTGPAAYISWRLVLTPLWALVVGVVPAYAIIDPYKPYGAIVMIMLLPVFVRFVRESRRVTDQSWRRLLTIAVVFGVAYSLLFLTYPGSSLWCMPGMAAAVLLAFPWTRRGALKLAAFIGTTTVVFAALAGFYVIDLLNLKAGSDRNHGFDGFTQPAFYAMWRTDMPGDVGQWPPPGELGGVGLFAIVTFTGLGIALWLGWRRSLTLTVICVFISTWLWRMWFASKMFATGEVQLWPRTDNQLLYLTLVGSALAVGLLAKKIVEAGQAVTRPAAHAGALFTTVMILGSAASSVSDSWMPSNTNTYKVLPYVSQTMRKPDGSCPTYAPEHMCSADGDQSFQKYFAQPRNH